MNTLDLADDLFSTPQATVTRIRAIPPFIWPESRVLNGMARYTDMPPIQEYLVEADLISGVLVGTDDSTIDWLREVLRCEAECHICLVIVLYPACPTRESHLRALRMVQTAEATDNQKLDIRLLPMSRFHDGECERPRFPPTAIQAHKTKTGRTLMSIGSVGDLGCDPCSLGSLNLVFQPDDALRDAWRRWFQYVFESAPPLTDANTRIPHLVPAEGDPEAAESWKKFTNQCQHNVGDCSLTPEVDPENGEVVAGIDGAPVQAWDDGVTGLDPLAQMFQKIYAGGCLVTVDESSRIKPLDIPVAATLLGQSSVRAVGALIQKQSFSLKIFDADVCKEIEKCRKITDLIDLLTFPLSQGNHWLPNTAKGLLDKELESRNQRGLTALMDALGGKPATATPTATDEVPGPGAVSGDSDEAKKAETAKKIQAFITASKEKIQRDLNGMYRALGQGEAVPESKLNEVLNEVEKRLTRALESRVTPTVTFNGISPPDLTEKAPGDNWTQPLLLLTRAARQFRRMLSDLYFPRQFTGMVFGEADFCTACNVFDDAICKTTDAQRAKDELAKLDSILDKDTNPKEKCRELWALISSKQQANC